MIRVLGTIKNSQYAGSFKDEQNDLIDWILEIQGGMYQYLVRAPRSYVIDVFIDRSCLTTSSQRSTSCFGNYANDNSSFDDAGSATLLASTVYRLSTLAGKHRHIPLAERTRIALSSRSNLGGGPVSGPFASMVHFDADGWLTPVPNPHSFGESGSKSSEAQAFVLMMQAGYQEWAQAGYKGVSTGVRSETSTSLVTSLAVSVALVLFLFR